MWSLHCGVFPVESSLWILHCLGFTFWASLSNLRRFIFSMSQFG